MLLYLILSGISAAYLLSKQKNTPTPTPDTKAPIVPTAEVVAPHIAQPETAAVNIRKQNFVGISSNMKPVNHITAKPKIVRVVAHPVKGTPAKHVGFVAMGTHDFILPASGTAIESRAKITK